MNAMKFPSCIARRLACGALLALCTASAMPAAPSLYAVEIVVFRSKSTSGALPEKEVLPNFTDDSIEATPAATGKLTAAVAKLRASKDGFNVLAHTAWTQGPTAYNSRQGVSAVQLRLGDSITGKVYLYRGTQGGLSLALDLTIEEGGRRYRIDERRPVKTNEVHYFDHPAMGVLAIVSPVPG